MHSHLATYFPEFTGQSLCHPTNIMPSLGSVRFGSVHYATLVSQPLNVGSSTEQYIDFNFFFFTESVLDSIFFISLSWIYNVIMQCRRETFHGNILTAEQHKPKQLNKSPQKIQYFASDYY